MYWKNVGSAFLLSAPCFKCMIKIYKVHSHFLIYSEVAQHGVSSCFLFSIFQTAHTLTRRLCTHGTVTWVHVSQSALLGLHIRIWTDRISMCTMSKQAKINKQTNKKTLRGKCFPAELLSHLPYNAPPVNFDLGCVRCTKLALVTQSSSICKVYKAYDAVKSKGQLGVGGRVGISWQGPRIFLCLTQDQNAFQNIQNIGVEPVCLTGVSLMQLPKLTGDVCITTLSSYSAPSTKQHSKFAF